MLSMTADVIFGVVTFCKISYGTMLLSIVFVFHLKLHLLHLFVSGNTAD